MYLCVNRIVDIIYAYKGLVVFFSASTVRSTTAWLPVNCACVPPLFQQLINTMLCPAFSGNLSVNLFAVYPFKYKLCIKILSSSLNTILIVDIEKHCSDVCCDEFPVPQIDRKSKKVKCICNQYCMGKDSLFLTPKTSKFVGE